MTIREWGFCLVFYSSAAGFFFYNDEWAYMGAMLPMVLVSFVSFIKRREGA